MISVYYFTSFREALNKSSDEVPASNIASVADLVSHLAAQDDNFQRVCAGDQQLLVAVNQTVVNLEHPLQDNDEVAFFPPMTGG